MRKARKGGGRDDRKQVEEQKFTKRRKDGETRRRMDGWSQEEEV